MSTYFTVDKALEKVRNRHADTRRVAAASEAVRDYIGSHVDVCHGSEFTVAVDAELFDLPYQVKQAFRALGYAVTAVSYNWRTVEVLVTIRLPERLCHIGVGVEEEL